MFLQYVFIFLLCFSLSSWTFRVEYWESDTQLDTDSQDGATRSTLSIQSRKLSRTHCSDKEAKFTESEGPCMGFDSLESVRHGLWEAWLKCDNPDLGASAAVFTAIGYGKSKTIHPANAKLKRADFTGQQVTAAINIVELLDPLTFEAEIVREEEKRSNITGLFTGLYHQYQYKPLESFSTRMSNIVRVTSKYFVLSDPERAFVAVSNDNESTAFLERLVACATLSWYDMMLKRAVEDVKAQVISNQQKWLYGEKHGQTTKYVDMELGDEQQVTHPWAQIALRAIPAFQMDPPFWLWGIPGTGDDWWPESLRLSHALNKLEGNSHMVCLEGSNEANKPLSFAIYMDLVDPTTATVQPHILIKRGLEGEEEMFKISFTTGLRDYSEFSEYSRAHSPTRDKFYFLDTKIFMQLSGGVQGGIEFIREPDECTLTILIDLKVKMATIKVEPSPDFDKLTNRTSAICNFDETIPKHKLRTFDVFGWAL